MESDLGKLFVGGISWDTDEDRLKEYFRAYGEVVETVIMRDRTTGRARGFGFVVFADPVVVERVVMEKHMIDGRTVEAKKTVPRDDHHIMNRNPKSIQGSPGPCRTKKIFVGGLASTVTESDFKLYFDQFGLITDVVVMYDHNTQSPRGFGFITYDSEEAVDRVLHKTFHELNSKMVEVKRAIPKELSPSPTHSPLVGYNYGTGRTNNLLYRYAQGYNLSSVRGYAVRMDARLNPVASDRSGFSPFGSLTYGMNMSLEPGLKPSSGVNSNFSNTIGYGRTLSSYHGGNSIRYNTPIGVNGVNGRSESFLNSPTRNLWGNGGLNSSENSGNADSYLGSKNGSFRVFGNNGANWGSSPISEQGGGSSSGYRSGTMGYGGGEINYGSGAGGLGGNNGPVVAVTSSFAASTGGYGGSYRDLYSGNSMYGDATWQTPSSEPDGSGSYGYGIGNAAEAKVKNSEGYIGNYSIANRQTKLIEELLHRRFHYSDIRRQI